MRKRETIIYHGNVVLEDSILFDGAVAMADGKITAVGDRAEMNVDEYANQMDAHGKYIAPGFVDIHNHGCNGVWMSDNPEQVAEFFLKRGTTTLLCNLFYSMGMEEYLSAIENVREGRKHGSGKIIAGLYMEGPYMNPKYGADSKHNQWNHPIRQEEYQRLVDACGDLVKIWCVAPEREGIEGFCRYAKSVNPGVVFSAGHCEAKPAMIYALKKYGLRSQTHHLNATGIVNPLCPDGKGGIRDCGPDEAALYDDSIYTELIADQEGIHVKPHNLRLVSKVKGDDRVVLITDSFPIGFAPCSGQFERATDLGFDHEGNLCGSKMSMDMACRNMFKHTGRGIAQIFKYAALNPARLIGMDDEIGSIEVGKKANFVIVDDLYHVDSVVLEGNAVK